MPILEEKAWAKLNLSLDVLGRRSDGYHDLRMIMQSVSLSDGVKLETGTGEGVRVATNLSFLPNNEKNLAAAAALRFFERTGAECGGVSITLDKHIPVCAGMGGGSSDAAAVLRGLNALTGTPLTPMELAELGGAVGSDVPYCVLGGTALAEGRGEVLTPLPTLPPCTFVLCKPTFSISTPQLFALVDAVKLRARPDTAGLVAALKAGDLAGVARRMYNVFGDVLPERQRRTVEEIRAVLLSHGALGASMSGTGPTVFGLFDDETRARGAWEELKESFRDTFLTSRV
mgnify:FL=1